MFRNISKKRLRLLFLLAILPIMVQMAGCGDGYEYSHTYVDEWGGGTINDTTAIIFQKVMDKYINQGALGAGGGSEHRLREVSLSLVDIRFEKIYWKKDIDFDGIYSSMRFDVIDSVLFFHVTNGPEKNYRIDKIAIIRIDEKFHQSKEIELKYKKIELKGKGWDSHSDNAIVRPWKDELLLARRAGSTPYALIDTSAGTMELWEPSGEFEWLNDCKDFKWSQVGGLCLKAMPDTSGFVLLRDGIDALAVRYKLSDHWPSWHFNGNAIILDGWRYLINNQGRVSENPLDVWGMGRFYDLDGNLLVDYLKYRTF